MRGRSRIIRPATSELKYTARLAKYERRTAVGQSNKNYILTHGVSRVDWRFYKHPRPSL